VSGAKIESLSEYIPLMVSDSGLRYFHVGLVIDVGSYRLQNKE